MAIIEWAYVDVSIAQSKQNEGLFVYASVHLKFLIFWN